MTENINDAIRAAAAADDDISFDGFINANNNASATKNNVVNNSVNNGFNVKNNIITKTTDSDSKANIRAAMTADDDISFDGFINANNDDSVTNSNNLTSNNNVNNSFNIKPQTATTNTSEPTISKFSNVESLDVDSLFDALTPDSSIKKSSNTDNTTKTVDNASVSNGLDAAFNTFNDSIDELVQEQADDAEIMRIVSGHESNTTINFDTLHRIEREAAARADNTPIVARKAGDRGKYVVKANKDFMLVGNGDIGSESFDIDSILSDGIMRGASDVHIAAFRPVKLRINGIMYKFAKYQIMDKNDMNDLMTAGTSLINKEMLQKFNTQRSADSAYVIRHGKYAGERFRVHFAEETNAPAIVFRHIRPQIFLPSEIGLTSDVVDWGLLSQGLILVTGPTGSGKSATLSSILRNVQLTKPGKIITLEEPIETVYPLDGAADVWQREVPENCPTFVKGIVDAMREDPDVILVGEIRDYPTIQAAMQACNTGHLTFATIHANSAPDVVTRVLDLAENADKTELMANLARNLKGILSQRLLLKPDNSGRIAVREVIQVGRHEKNLIAKGDVDQLAQDLADRGEDLDSQMVKLLLERKTTFLSARSASTDRERFDTMIKNLSSESRKRIIFDVPKFEM